MSTKAPQGKQRTGLEPLARMFDLLLVRLFFLSPLFLGVILFTGVADEYAFQVVLATLAVALVWSIVDYAGLR